MERRRGDLPLGLKQPGSVALDASKVYFVDNRDSSDLVATADIASLLE